jgi:hypothetical protein
LAITGSYDIVFQFRQDVVNDVIRRQLADPTTTNPRSPRFLPRQLVQQQLPGQIQSLLSWGDPAIDLDEADTLVASVELSGGFRPPVVERNLSLAATARMRIYPLFTLDEVGAPYVTAHPASADTLELAGSKVSYAVAAVPLPLGRAELSQIVGSLLPFVSRALLTPLSELPLTYAPESLIPFVRDYVTVSVAEATTVHGAEAPAASPAGTGVQVLAAREAQVVAAGVTVAGARQAIAGERIGLALPLSGEGNAAITITDAGMNAILNRLGASGGLGGTIHDPTSGRAIDWRWDSLACAFASGMVTLTGQLRVDGATHDVRAELLCALDASGRLTLTPRAGIAADPIGAVVADSWQTLLRAILTVNHAMQTGAGGDPRLVQRFRIPGTSITEAAAATALRCDPGELTLVYALPLAGEHISLQPPSLTPTVSIKQTVVPPQARYGAPVTAAIEAEVTRESFAPYDFVWTAEQRVQVLPPVGQHTTIIGRPRQGGVPGEKVLTNTSVTVVDLAGQTASNTGPVRYVSARRSRGQRGARAALVVALLLALVTSVAVVRTGRASSCLPNVVACLSNAFGVTAPAVAPTSTSVPYCSTTSQFANAGAASAGPDFGDVGFPVASVGLTSPQSPAGYTFTLVNACSNSTTPDAIVTFFTQELTGAGWSVVKTFPVNGDPTAACPSSYCWRKAADTSVRYVMLEQPTASGKATIYDLQLATAPAPQSTLAVHTATATIAAFQAASVSVSCQSGEQMLSGGYSFPGGTPNQVDASYPSGPATWTVVGAMDQAGQSVTLTVSVACLQANFTVGMTQVTSAAATSAYLGSATASVSCPQGSVLTGGGFLTTPPDDGSRAMGQIGVSAPLQNGWTVTVNHLPTGSSLTEQAIALCATKNLTAAPLASQTLQPATQGTTVQGTAACASGQLLTGGGFTDLTGTPGLPNQVFSKAEVESVASALQWAVSFTNGDQATHNAQITSVCATATPEF